MKIWDAASGEELRTVLGPGGGLATVRFSPDGRFLVLANKLEIQFWDANTGHELRTLNGLSLESGNLAISPDGRRLATCSSDRTVKILDAVSGRELLTFLGHTAAVRCVAFSPDGQRLASSGRDGTVKIWDAGGGQGLPASHSGPGVAFSPDGRCIASPDGSDLISRSGTVWIRDAASLQVLFGLSGHTRPVRSAAFSPDGERLASGSIDGTVRIWDAATGREQRVLHWGGADGMGAYCVAFSPDSTRLVACDRYGTVKIWAVVSGQDLGTLLRNPSTIKILTNVTVAFSPDGRWLAASGSDSAVKVWDAGSLQEQCTLKSKDGSSPGSLAFSPDSQRLATAHFNRTIKVWDLASCQEVPSFEGHAYSPTNGMAFSPDGGRLVLACGGLQERAEVEVLDAATGRGLLTLTDRDGGMNGVAFSPGGQRLVTAGPLNGVKIWDGRPLSELVRIEREALGLVSFLFAKPLLKKDVVQRLRDNETINVNVRRKALALAERFAEVRDPETFYEASRALVLQKFLAPRWYQDALAQAQAACTLKPDEGAYLTLVGVAQYRLGKYPEALDTLAGSLRFSAASRTEMHLARLAFLAMSHHQLGTRDEAKAALATIRTLLKNRQSTAPDDVQNCLLEAETLINPDKPDWTLRGLIDTYRIAGAIEGEELTVLRKSGGFPVHPQDMTRFSGGSRWSGRSHLLAEAAKTGDWVELALPVLPTDSYRIIVHLTKAPDFGIVRFYVDGKPVGEPIDCFHVGGVVTTGPIDLGKVLLKTRGATSTLRLKLLAQTRTQRERVTFGAWIVSC